MPDEATRWVDMSRSLKDWVAADAPRLNPPKPLKRELDPLPSQHQGHPHAQRQR